ncbi:hypothetical protein OPV22_020111 [Ensete ventricosum]|uniref:DUF4005 domain-containing protein n=1 Tax=Ensete ventricosum TaxID=4639 RepID=A0AAV8QIK8_ENSVE|nr:hypothetical protein OPV22_020111 [Ensete ventricosum]
MIRFVTRRRRGLNHPNADKSPKCQRSEGENEIPPFPILRSCCYSSPRPASCGPHSPSFWLARAIDRSGNGVVRRLRSFFSSSLDIAWYEGADPPPCLLSPLSCYLDGPIEDSKREGRQSDEGHPSPNAIPSISSSFATRNSVSTYELFDSHATPDAAQKLTKLGDEPNHFAKAE